MTTLTIPSPAVAKFTNNEDWLSGWNVAGLSMSMHFWWFAHVWSRGRDLVRATTRRL